MPSPDRIDFVFFDIGGTLGDRHPTSGKLVPFPTTIRLLTDVRDKLKLPMGVITTLGPLSNDEGLGLLQQAGLSGFLAPNALISEHDVNGKGKPSPEIYRFAANKMGVDVERCLFVGENLTEVMGAITAGMKAVLKPCPPGRDLI
jgi:HAD superfamily hydrolase (TIGR01509 family)